MRAGKPILVWAAALMMIANPASACRWRVRSYCAPVYCGPTYCEPSSCGPVYSEPSCCETTMPVDCSACGESSDTPTTTNRIPEAAPPTPAPPEPPTPQPTFEPAPPAAAPAPAPAPAPADIVPPATAPERDPFSAPPERMPVERAPATPAPAPSEVEDLFSDPSTTPAAPAEEPPTPSSDVDDLFKDPAPAPTTPEKPSDDVDDLFKDLDDNKAAASEAPADPPANKEIEDLFSDPEPSSPMSAAAEPAVPQSEDVATDEAATELAAEATPVEMKSAPPATQAGMRLWTDDTGRYQVRGRLVVVGPSSVRLLKENGKFTTVPYARLSQPDLAFVKQHSNGAVVASF